MQSDAVGGRGRIVIETTVEDEAPSTGGQGLHVVVKISDDGVGIPDDVKAWVFDPFFTTKAEGQGTGLGLSVSYGIVERHGGIIVVDSTPRAGSTFTVYLPVRQSQDR